MRFVHTSDWHLGHSLHDLPRRAEHLAFLRWLRGVLQAEEADALLVAGDVFETSNPSAEAQGDWYEFLAATRRQLPRLGIVVIGGNHDSAARLDAPDPVLRALEVHVVGGLPRRDDGTLDAERATVALHDRDGRVVAHVVALPFLRAADLPAVDAPDADPLVEGVRRRYADAVGHVAARRGPGEAIVAMGHLYMVDGRVSELSERKILGGNQHALPAGLFPPEVAYVALGHLHLAQKVGGDERIRYSGSPLPLSFDESGYTHQVLVVDLDGERIEAVRTVPVPRSVPLLRIPAEGPAPIEDVEAALAALQVDPLPRELQPLLEVRVLLQQPEPGLRARVDAAIADKPVRLARIATSYAGSGAALADASGAKALRELRPEDVFHLRWRGKFDADPPPEVLAAFGELLDAAHQARETP